jgi:hypothetical protein
MRSSLKNITLSIILRLKERRRYNRYYAAVKGKIANTSSIAARLNKGYVPVKHPLVLVSQIERSGGSMIAQLFDGHPEILAHPHELKIGYPNKINWPPTDIENVDEQFRVLFELSSIEHIENGYSKSQDGFGSKNFFLIPQLQRDIFRACLARSLPTDSRAVLNAYFTSYFNAWLNMRASLQSAKIITGFVPTLSSDPSNMERYWMAYPDGHFISILRSPLSWYPSYKKLKRNAKTDILSTSCESWKSSTEAMFREKRLRPNQVTILCYDNLVTHTDRTMRMLCSRIGINFDTRLVTPTFNWEPIGSNSLFDATQPGIVSTVPIHRDELLTNEERNALSVQCVPLYQRAIREIVNTPLHNAF